MQDYLQQEENKTSHRRLYNLDYLRGLAAFGIMIYHYLFWTFGELYSDSFIGRHGVYGVSVFYVLSGLTLYYVYYDKMKPSREDITSFFKKRIFRIFPLLWLVTIIGCIEILLLKEEVNYTNLFLNLSGLFGFVRWDKCFSAGVWSIGNELVFYVFFPFFVLFTKKLKPLMILFGLILFGLYLYFAFVKLSPNLSLVEQWKDYVNPLNQIFLFLGGFLIGFFLHKRNIKNSIILPLLFFALSVFVFYPATGDTIKIVTGTNRLVFTACCFLICICFYKMTIRLPKFIHKPLTLLGEASYSVYLLHPIVHSVMGVFLRICSKYFQFPQLTRMILSIIFTLIISYFVYQYFEKYFMKFGRKTINNPQ